MNCEQANQIDLVDYLNSLGYQPQKIRGSDYWYLSPFRDEKEPSFKINRSKNLWYDHGPGKGGKLVDFVMEFHRCDVSDTLQKLSSFHPQNHFKNKHVRPQFHLHKNSLADSKDAREPAIKIIAAKQPIQDLALCRYLWQRRIDKTIVDHYCHEVHFTNVDQEKIYKAIGFKNNAGGYELPMNILREAALQSTLLTWITKQKTFRQANRYIIYQAILEKLPKCKTLDELKEKLAKEKIETLFKYKGHTNELQGISFKKGDYKYKGSEIDRKFSINNLQKILRRQQTEKLFTSSRDLWYTKSAFENKKMEINKPLIKVEHVLNELMRPEQKDQSLPPDWRLRKTRKKKSHGLHS